VGRSAACLDQLPLQLNSLQLIVLLMQSYISLQSCLSDLVNCSHIVTPTHLVNLVDDIDGGDVDA
jgi:hypothetical protein